MPLCVDCETSTLDLRHSTDNVFIVTFCRTGEEPFFYEWSVDPFTRKAEIPESDKAEIRELILSADCLVGQNLKFDNSALKQNRIIDFEWPWERTHDTLISGHVLNSLQGHDLTTMALAYLHENIQPLEKALEKAVQESRRICRSKAFREKHGIWRIAEKGLPEMPSAREECWRFDYWLPRAIAKAENYAPSHPWWTVASEYANCDSFITGKLWQSHERLLKERGLWEIYLARRNALAPLSEMENHGITIKESNLIELTERYSRESEEAGNACREFAKGYGVDLHLPKSGRNGSLNKFVFETLKLPVVKWSKKTGIPSLDAKVKEAWMGMLPIGSPELEFVKNLQGKQSRDTACTYMSGYRRYCLPIRTRPGWFRLHPSINPTGTKATRISTSNPSEQNISNKEEFNLRYCFCPAPGRWWASFDYSNLELRIPAYEAGETEMIDLFERPDDPPYFGSVHALMFHTVYPKEFDESESADWNLKKTYPALYKRVKNGDFATQYGAQEYSGTADRAYGVVGAFRSVKQRFSKIHGPGGLNKKWCKFADRNGYVETMIDLELGGKRGYPLFCQRANSGKVIPTIPLSYHVQGTAGWVMMRARQKVWEYLKSLTGWRIVMDVHDEMVVEFPNTFAGYQSILLNISALMESVSSAIGVPLKVGIELHRENWSEGETIHAEN